MSDAPPDEAGGRWARLDALFAEAADLPDDERGAFLEALRRDDAALAGELASLLKWDSAQGGAYLEDAVHGAVASILDRAGPDRRGTRLGPYRILEELGHGGMGTVYLAERADGAYEARVAIKLIRGGIASRDQVRRFKAERQILAGLDHPNIARMLDGGTTSDGLPYVVMEVVEGEPIDSYCDRLRLSVVDRIHLFRAVCDAVTYAHRNLVVHRDLKPGNILVTDDGVPKLLDFGIAKLLEADDEGRTVVRTALAMTPAYASPEQVRGETVTTATDVYALGAVLYELLTGHPAHRFETSTPGEIERVICREGPDRPSTVVTRTFTSSSGDGAPTPAEVGGARSTDPGRLRSTLSGDLDTILLMALRKEPERRYASVEAFSRDLANYLLGLPVVARGDAWSYRARKFASRNRGAVAGTTAAALLVTALVSFYTLRLADERDRARVEADKAERLADFLGGLFTIDERNPAAGAAVTAGELLDRGAASVAEIEDPEVRADLQYNLGLAYGNLGLFAQAGPMLDASEATIRELRGLDDPETSAVRTAVADILWERGEYAAADSVLTAALPGFADYPEQYAATISSRGRALLRLGRFEEARDAYERALAMYDEMDGDRRRNRGIVLGQLGQVALALDDRDQAEAYLRDAVAVHRELDAEGDGDLPTVLQSLASVLLSQRRLDEAEPLLLESLALDETRLGPDHPLLSPTLTELSSLHLLQDDPQGALPFARRAVAIGRARGEDHGDLAYDLASLAQVLLRAGDAQEAEATAREAVRMSAATDGPDSPFLARAILTLGVVLRDRGEFSEAEARLDEALAIAEAALPAGHSFTANLRMNRGQIRQRAGDEAGAEADLQAAHGDYAAAFGEDDPRTREAAGSLAELYEEAGRLEEAARWRTLAGN